MHVPDGFLDAPTSLATAGVAAVGVAIALKGARREVDDRVAPLAGLVATFVFATQMLNFPVAGGTSGHLMGGALAAVLVGPYTGLLCLTVVLAVQSLLFADGGITALGALTSVVLSAATFVGLYAVGGTVPIPLDTLLPAMVGIHVLIGVGEAVITFLVVASIVSVRPDLVHGARRVLDVRPLETRVAA